MDLMKESVNRRSFIKAGVAGATGLAIGFYLPTYSRSLSLAGAVTDDPAKLNAWVHIGTNDVVTIVIDKSEMGQGIQTALAMLVAEELECDWKRVRTEFAPAAKEYINLAFGIQGTGGSASIRSSYQPMLKAGAAAREMLLEAAAQQWKVQKSSCHAENGVIVHNSSGKRATYGSLSAAAAKLPPPKEVVLKDPKRYKIVGKPTKRLDTMEKVDGSAKFGLDIRIPGMVYAVVARCPVFGGKVASFDAAKAKAVPGVRRVLEIPSGIAVIADNTWTAMQGKRALEIKWDEGPNAAVSSASISKLFADKTAQPATVVRKDGDTNTVLSRGTQKIEAVYEAPYQSHATMEPMNCTADVRPEGVDVWAPTQFQGINQLTAAGIAKVDPSKVRIHTTYLGTGFGRRGEQDFVAEAVQISKAVSAPVHLTWSREDDMQHDFYRPASHCRFWASLNANGMPEAWLNRLACSSIMNHFMPGSIKNGIDPTSVEGCDNIPYSIPNIQVEYSLTETGIPVSFWRSVGNSQNGFFSESFIDELAHAAKKDPYEYRRSLLSKAPRHLAVLELAAQKANWGKPLPPGRFRGIAVLTAFGSYAAQVVEISVDRAQGRVKVHRVICAIDCGRYVNPATIEAQAQSCVVYGLSAAMKGAITIAGGRVEQGNFNQYDMLRIGEMPVVESYIVPSEEAPTGIGELCVAQTAPALCNAIFAATGKRIRKLPVRPEDLKA